MYTKQPLPQEPELERAVLGAIFFDPDDTVSPTLAAGGADLFENPFHERVMKAVEHLHTEGEFIDQLTVTDCMHRLYPDCPPGIEDDVCWLVTANPSSANILAHLDILKRSALLRRLIRGMDAVRNDCYAHDADGGALLERMAHMAEEVREFAGVRKTVADTIREWVDVTDGDFSVTDCYRDLNLVTSCDKAACRKALTRLVEEGVIERTGRQRGRYRRIADECEKMDWRRAPTEVLDLRWPFALEKYVEVMPGNVVVVAGEPNAGKTAFLLNVVKMNMARHDIHFFSSEMGASELRKRLERFGDVPPGDWRFTPWERSADFEDVVKPDAVNIIDYLEIHEDFYRLGGQIKRIFHRLRHGVAVIAIQKNVNTDIGRGGIATLEKPRLYLALKPGECTIVKGKNWASRENPQGKTFPFKLVGGSRFVEDCQSPR